MYHCNLGPLVPVAHSGDIGQKHPGLARGLYHHALYLPGGVELPYRPYPVVPPLKAHGAGRDVDILRRESAHYIVYGQAVGGKGSGVDDNMHLLLGAAADEQVGNPLHPFKVLAHLVFEVCPVGAGWRRVLRLSFKYHPDDGRGGRAGGVYHGLIDIDGVGRDLVYLVRHAKQGVVHERAYLEAERYRALVVKARTLHLDEAGNALQNLLLLLDYLPLHLIWSGTRPDGGHGNLRLCDIRGKLVGHPPQAYHAEQDDEYDADDNGDRFFYRETDYIHILSACRPAYLPEPVKVTACRPAICQSP